MAELTTDENILRQWIGRTEHRDGIIDAEPARRMQALLDHDPVLGPGDSLLPLWTWLYFPENHKTSILARDGRTVPGNFLPPVSLPRRMWAGGRFCFNRPLIIGAHVSKTSEIIDIRVRQGRSGMLCLITARHRFATGEGICITEEHDMVYREAPSPNAPKRILSTPPADADLSRTITPSAVMLFRYSALTYNSHRIHYDRTYCRTVEGYPDLVFYGPLTATLLANLALEVTGGR